MRWGVVSLILGWTIGLVSVPLVVVGLYSLYVEGFEQAIAPSLFRRLFPLIGLFDDFPLRCFEPSS